MKKLLIFAIGVLFIACHPIHTVRPTGSVTTEERMVDYFNEISVNSGINLVVYNGAQEVAVQTNRNIHDYIETYVKKNTLIVRAKPHTSFTGKTNITVYVTAENIRSIDASGGSKVSMPSTITADRLSLDGSGGARFDGFAYAGRLNLELSGGAKADLGVDCEEMNFKFSGGSSAAFSGYAEYMETKMSGGSKLNGYGLIVNRLYVNMSGGSSVQISVDNAISGELSGGSKLQYKGNPTVDAKTSGGSKISKVK